MAKSSKHKIEKDNNLVLDELQKNSKKSINEIAKKLGFSRQKVWRIIKELEDNKTIWGYTAVVNEEKKDLSSFVILIKRTLKPADKNLIDLIISRKLEELADELDVIIEHSYYTNGICDWIICLKSGNIANAKKFCEVLLKTYKGYIENYNLIEILFPIRVQGIINPELEKLNEFL